VLPEDAFSDSVDADNDDPDSPLVRSRSAGQQRIEQRYALDFAVLVQPEFAAILGEGFINGSQALSESSIATIDAARRNDAVELVGEKTDARMSAGSGLPLKRAALVTKHLRLWPTVDRDLRDASTNGLADTAKAAGRTGWIEDKALAWARSKGKILDAGPSPRSIWPAVASDPD